MPDAYDCLLMLRDLFSCMTWFVAIVYFLSGSQDLVYDIGAYWLRFWRQFTYRNAPRLSLERLRAREQQRIAVMVPAWNEGEVVASMVDNIIKRVEYDNYSIFVGTYPNDPATQGCVDRLSKEFPQIIKVVTASGRALYNHVTTSVGFMSSSDRRAHFGLGSESAIDHVEIRWPSGIMQRIDRPAVDRILKVEEQEATPSQPKPANS